jgi:phosphoribosylamine--glycine ligase
MRVGIVSAGYHLPFSARLQEEGCDILVYVGGKYPGASRYGQGIVPMTNSYEELVEFCKEHQDERKPTVMIFDNSSYGEKADDARKSGLNVIGGSKFCDKLEGNRDFGLSIAQSAGAVVPDHEAFSTITAAIAYAKTLGDIGTFFKTDRFSLGDDSTYGANTGAEMAQHLTSLRERYGDRMRCILQDKIDGVAISTARWFNGREFVGPFEGTIEHKKLLNDDVGPSTGCSLNSIWLYPDETSFISKLLCWSNLSELFRSYDAPPGYYDMNAIVTEEGEAYFLEWTARFGYDSNPTCAPLISDLSSFFWNVATGQGLLPTFSSSIAFSTRLWVPPYPAELTKWLDEKHTAVGTQLFGIDKVYGVPFSGYGVRYRMGHHEIASSDGEIGIALGIGKKLSAINKSVVEFAGSLRPTSIAYRTDGDKVIKADAERIKDVVPDLPKGLMQ